MDIAPTLSIVIPALKGTQTILAALHSWRAQTAVDQLEILILSPDRPGAPELRVNERWISSANRKLHEARAIALREASAQFAVLAEDHCLPAPDWAEQMIRRLDEGWDAVGPGLYPATPHHALAAASFLVGYAQWMVPVKGGPAGCLPGHNSVIRRSLVLGWSDGLEKELLVASFLMQRLSREGARMFLEPQARMWHFDSPKLSKSLQIFACVGLGFGARRVAAWPLPARWLFSLAAPLVAVRHWWRAAVHYHRAGRQAKLNPATPLVTMLWASVWACGEALGAIAGLRRVVPVIAISELKPVSRDQAKEVLSQIPGLESAPLRIARAQSSGE